jgi:hypothetical protein
VKIGRTIIAIPLILSLLTPMTAFAATQTYQTEVVNTGRMGQVAISLKEYELDEDGNEVTYQNGKIVVPGDKIDKIVRISNLGNDAWIRVKVEYLADEGIKGIDDSQMVLADDEHWKKIGDYYYYTEPVPQGTAIDFMKAFNVPLDMTEEQSGKQFSIHITSDAVQERNFTPNFEAEDPWFGTVIEQRIYQPFDISPEAQEPFSVEFKDGSEGLVKVGDDFFSNWGTLLPGDTFTDKITVGNNYSKEVEIFFHTETIADDELLKQIQITIKNGNTVIYEGPLSGTVEKVSLGTFKKGETTDLFYTIHVPAELTNKYALADTKTKWIFTTSLGSDTSSDSSTKSSSSSSSSSRSSSSSSSSSEKPGVLEITSGTQIFSDDGVPLNPFGFGSDSDTGVYGHKTGDSNVVQYALTVAGISTVLLILVILSGKRKKRHTRDKKI